LSVDFVIGDHAAVEVKAKENIAPHDLTSLHALAEERRLKRATRALGWSRGHEEVGEIMVLPVQEFLENYGPGNTLEI
jgi:uncharacterized protein